MLINQFQSFSSTSSLQSGKRDQVSKTKDKTLDVTNMKPTGMALIFRSLIEIYSVIIGLLIQTTNVEFLAGLTTNFLGFLQF